MISVAIHHIAVQTTDLPASVAWYEECVEAVPTWSLDQFAPLTHDRLPGIRELTEMVAGPVRFHLFIRAGTDARPSPPNNVALQHICLSVDTADDLVEIRDRWERVWDSGRYAFRADGKPTEIVVDADGVQSFYGRDPNGLEYEITYIPEALGDAR